MSKQERVAPEKMPPVKVTSYGGGGGGSSGTTPRTLMPPILKEVGKLAAGVAAVATTRAPTTSGSATGNPRNKCALQPGHSLMDWIRLGSSGKDLTGVGPRAGKLTVTRHELAQHNKLEDAWIGLNGKVFNITSYIPFHPGGAEEMMKGAGKDATSLFNEIHAWVNYESILQKCYIGRLSNLPPNINTEELFFGKSRTTPTDPPAEITSVLPTPNNNNNNNDLSLPRFDWIQKTDFITVIFYTKPCANPRVQIHPPIAESLIDIVLNYSGVSFVNQLDFAKPIQWPGQIKINYETGKVEVQFRKGVSGIWENYGTLKQRKMDAGMIEDDGKRSYVVINKIEITYNTFLVELQRVDGGRATVPIGKHVKVFHTLQGEETNRSYTPVPSCLVSKFKPQNFITDNVHLMVKSYPKGCVSRYICSRKKGDVVEMSRPLGSFRLEQIEGRETFLFLAAGTGITPMLSLLLFLLERRIRKCQKVTLVFFNRTEGDIPFRAQLDRLEREDSRFVIRHVLSQADSHWRGIKGQIRQPLLEDLFQSHLEGTVYKKEDVFVFVCGPTLFTNLANSLLAEYGLVNEQIHLFIG